MAWPVDLFSDEQSRTLVNLHQQYEVWIEAERTLAGLPYDLRRKEVGGRAYLYEITDRNGNGQSLGPWSPTLQVQFDAYRETKAIAKDRREKSRERMAETCRLYRALRLPLLASAAGEILRECDRRRLLDKQLLVIGTNTMPAYNIEAVGFIRDAPDETMDLDLAWAEASDERVEAVLWPMLKAVDPSFTVNSERDFQARNRHAYEVEFLAAPSTADTLSPTDRPRPIVTPSQEWLLLGRRVDHVVVCRDGLPARIVAPDPRWFGLHKLWLADTLDRTGAKRVKDTRQGTALLDAVWTEMGHYPLDAAFEAELPPELTPYYQRWKERRPAKPEPRW